VKSLEENFNGKNCLITGGLGFIGSNLAHRLASCGANVLIVDSLVPQYGGNLFNVKDIKDKVKINIADVRDSSSMNRLVQNQDYIFNLAGQVSHVDSMHNPYPDLEINVKGQLIVLEACRRNNPNVKIIYAGSRSQYGRAERLPVDEKHLMHPTDINGVNKVAGEAYHLVYYNAYGLRTCSLRLTNTFGERQYMRSNRQTYLAWFIRLALDNKTIEIYGKGKQLRDFNYVSDVVDAMLLAAGSKKADGETFNLGSGKPISVIDSAKKVIEVAGSGALKQVPFPAEKKRIEIGDYYADFEKIKSTLGWKPKISFAQGLQRTIDFYRKYKTYYW